MYFILPYFPEFTEHIISRGLFKLVTIPLGFVSSIFPFSLTEIAAVTAFPAFILVLVLFIRKMKKSKERKKTAFKAGRIFCGFLSFALFLYMTAHGCNYYRLKISDLMGLDTSPKTADFLLEVCGILAEGAKQARGELTLDENGCVKFEDGIFNEFSRTSSGYKAIVEGYPFLNTGTWRQKPVMLSYYWSYTGIVGMYFPFFGECNVNIEQPDFSIPFTASHESAHSRGIAREDECNFLAFLSCINSEYPEFRYSGYMNAFKYCSNALYKYDKDMWAEAYSHCSEGMVKDFLSENDYIDRFKGKVWETSTAVNNTFIKVQGVEKGELSYGEVTALILAYYADNSEN